jgi:hypothetical protein
MRACRFWYALAGLAVLAGLSPTAAKAGTFLIDGRAAGLSDTPIKTGWSNMVGLVDDYIDLADGESQLFFEGPGDYLLTLKVRVEGDDIRVLETGSQIRECGRELEVTWPAPRVDRDPAHPRVARLRLARASATPTGESIPCPMYSLGACDPQKVIVEIASQPPGGEIWFRKPYGDWEKQDFRTNVTLSVPFCGYQESKPLLVRMPGRVNCLQDLPLAPDARLTVACDLRVPGEAAALETSAPPE